MLIYHPCHVYVYFWSGYREDETKGCLWPVLVEQMSLKVVEHGIVWFIESQKGNQKGLGHDLQIIFLFARESGEAAFNLLSRLNAPMSICDKLVEQLLF